MKTRTPSLLQRITGYVVCALLVVLAFVFFTWRSPQRAMARRLAGADRVVLAYLGAGYENRTFTVTGEDAKGVVRAVAHGRKEPSSITASPSFRLDFFQGAIHLETLTNSLRIFWIGPKAFSDQSGVFEQLHQRAQEQEMMRSVSP